MEDESKKPDYPCLDITIEDWNNEECIPLWDDLSGTRDHAIIVEVFQNHLFVDCNGDIFEIVGVEPLATWRRYVPFISQGRLIARFTGQSMTLEEFRTYMLGKVDSLDIIGEDFRDFQEDWRVKILKAQSIAELILS